MWLYFAVEAVDGNRDGVFMFIYVFSIHGKVNRFLYNNVIPKQAVLLLVILSDRMIGDLLLCLLSHTDAWLVGRANVQHYTSFH